MASTCNVGDDDGRLEHIKVLLDTAKELKSYIQSNLKKIRDLRSHKHIDDSVASDVEVLYKDQQIIKRRFHEFDNFFTASDEHGDLALSEEGNKEKKALKCRVEKLKKEEQALNLKLERILSILEHKERIISQRRTMWSRELKIIKFYYHQLFVSSSGNEECLKQEKSRSIFRRGEEGYFLYQLGYMDSDFRVNNFEDVAKIIHGFLYERRQEDWFGMDNFMERLNESPRSIAGDTYEHAGTLKILKEIPEVAIHVGTLISECSGDFLLAVSESRQLIWKYRNFFKCLIELLIDDQNERKGVDIAIKKVVSVLKFAERELMKLGKLKHEVLNDDGPEIANEDDEWKEISSLEMETDRVLEILLREVLCLECFFSYPNLCHAPANDEELLHLQASNLNDALVEGREILKNLKSQLERELVIGKTDLILRHEFTQVLETKILETWRLENLVEELLGEPFVMNAAAQQHGEWVCMLGTCNRGYPTEEGLRRHRRAVHKKSQERCEECNVRMENDSEYETHSCSPIV